MKTKKVSSIIAVAGACALVVFSIAVFPFILAASPDNDEIITIETETYFPAEDTRQIEEDVPAGEAGQSDESDFSGEAGLSSGHSLAVASTEPDEFPSLVMPEVMPGINEATPDINAISKEMAMNIARDMINPRLMNYWATTREHGEFMFSLDDPDDTIYAESIAPTADPSWYVHICVHQMGAVYMSIPANLTPEEYLEEMKNIYSDVYIGTDNNSGETVLKDPYDITYYVAVEVNAFTGEYIGFSLFKMSDSDFGVFNYDELKQNMVYIEPWKPVLSD